ncbi:MAG TPA: aspartate kinase [Geobacteraceae bacterium]|nr:aspartate kinase [Geobacteraceae bacterium]
MALVVQKYGGNALNSRDGVFRVAQRIINTYNSGNDLVVAVSAPREETGRLVGMTRDIHSEGDSRISDLIISTADQLIAGQLSLALTSLGYKAVPYLGWQIPIRTDFVASRAFIQSIDPERIRSDIEHGAIVIVAGQQGIDAAGNITTLGRDDEDTAAVALADVLQAEDCEIFTDVDGIYTADPAVCSEALKMERLTYDEMLELSRAGTLAVQTCAVEYAMKHDVELHIRSAFTDGPGTLVTKEESTMDANVVTGIAYDKSEAKIAVIGIPDKPGVAAKILTALAKDDISVDMIVQNVSQAGLADLTFSVKKQELSRAHAITRDIADELQAKNVVADERICKVSIVGIGMRSHAGVAARMFSALAYNNINIQMISTSDIKISVAIEEKYTELAVRILHETFIPDSQSKSVYAS